MTKPFDTCILCDFDGTAAAADLSHVILNHFAGDAWIPINEEWDRCEISTAERVRRQFALFHTTERELGDLVSQVGLDPFFGDFVALCESRHWPLVLVSDGFDFYISRILAANGLERVRYVANRLGFVDGEMTFDFLSQDPTCDRCGNCKRSVLRDYRTLCERIVYIGDGLSDRCPAAEADVVFAKGKLQRYCEEQGIAIHPFVRFDDVIRALTQPSGLARTNQT